MFLDCSGHKQHKSVTEAIDFLHSDMKAMHSKGDNSKLNVSKIMKRLYGLCQNGTVPVLKRAYCMGSQSPPCVCAIACI